MTGSLRSRIHAAEINAREVESSRKVLSDQIIALEAQAQLLINKRKDFFASHFGLKPQAEISKLYLLDEQGNWKGVSTGAATNSIANEIMTYKSPAPSDSGLTQGEMVGLLMNMVKRYELQQQVSNLSTGLTAEDIKTIYTLERRPTYEEYKSVLETYNATNWGKQGIPLGQGKYVRPTLSNVLGYGYWKTLTCQAITEAARRGFKGKHTSIHKDSTRQASPSMSEMSCNTMKEHTEVAGLSPSGSFAASTESESTLVGFVVAHQVR